MIIEDVTFPIPRLAAATLDLQDLLRRHGYTEAVIFGHALDGNLHFVFTQDFDDHAEVVRYDGFIQELTSLVVEKYDGALKAEHGTGRNMAPFVEYEWGPQALALMREIKDAFDPGGLFNPGVILNDDPNAHLADLKPLPPADPIVDVCIECGFCESSCISHGLTYSPRQRIVLQREIARLRAAGHTAEADAMHETIHYGFNHTCSTDGLCAIACPVDIDTGKYVKQFRAEARHDSKVAGAIADNYGAVTSVVRVALRSAKRAAGVVGHRRMDRIASDGDRVGRRHHPLGPRHARPGEAPTGRRATDRRRCDEGRLLLVVREPDLRAHRPTTPANRACSTASSASCTRPTARSSWSTTPRTSAAGWPSPRKGSLRPETLPGAASANGWSQRATVVGTRSCAT